MAEKENKLILYNYNLDMIIALGYKVQSPIAVS